ncbi:MAG: sugar phosphate isomerase/epimerase [Candidatus Hydrogenedentes bacterium]|nr:sugar phosphate isomerase/epimerase [Candidatus Hydrogenedentota bacterium]
MKKISIGSWAYSIGPYQDCPIPWSDVLRELKGLGFDGVEVGGFSIHPSPENHPTKEDRARVKEEAAAIGLGFSAFVPNLWAEKLINTEDTSVYVAKFKEGLQFAVDIGTKGVRVDAVQPPTIFDEVDYDTAKNRIVKTWKECAKLAADQGCYVTWEFEPGFAFNKPSDIERIVDEVNEDNFGVMFDTCHAEMVAGVGARQPGEKEVLPGGCLEFAKRMKGKINHIHLIDSDGTLHHDETSSHPPFGDGYLDFDAIVPVLLDAGVAHDWWTIDLCFWPDAWKVTERCKKSIDELNKKFCS